MPKKTTNPSKAALRARSRTAGAARKAARIAENEARAAANRAAGKAPKRQTRKRRADNLRSCVYCHTRTIVAGRVCWCKQATGGRRS